MGTQHGKVQRQKEDLHRYVCMRMAEIIADAQSVASSIFV